MNTWKVESPNRLLTEVKDKLLEFFSAKDLKWSIEHNRCFVNKNVERFCSASVKRGDIVALFPEKMPLERIEKERILFEDENLIVYNKPPYLASEKLGELLNAFLAHRLDRDTSGVILLAKNKEVLAGLEQQFQKRTILKQYLAWVEGATEAQGTVSGNMAAVHRREGAVIWGMKKEGIFSKTEWRTIKTSGGFSLLQCVPITGRTHQIRVHLKHVGHPIVGDYVYGFQKLGPAFRPLLHAFRLTCVHPVTLEKMTFSAPLPDDFNL